MGENLPYYNCIVRIRNAEGIVGAGFLASDRHIYTCAHVIMFALGLPDDAAPPLNQTVLVDFPFAPGQPKPQFEARVVKFIKAEADGSGDIAGLELVQPLVKEIKDAIPLASYRSVDAAQGQQMRVCGFPVGYEVGSSMRLSPHGERKDGSEQ